MSRLAIGLAACLALVSTTPASAIDPGVASGHYVAEDQKVTVWYTVDGTHSGEFEGVAPTGRRVKWAGVDLFTIERNRITEARFLSDLHGLLTQLGATSSAQQ